MSLSFKKLLIPTLASLFISFSLMSCTPSSNETFSIKNNSSEIITIISLNGGSVKKISKGLCFKFSPSDFPLQVSFDKSKESLHFDDPRHYNVISSIEWSSSPSVCQSEVIE